MTLPPHGLSRRDIEYLVALVTGFDSGWHQAGDVPVCPHERGARRAARRLAGHGMTETARGGHTERRYREDLLLVRATDLGRAYVAWLTTQHNTQNAAK